MSPLRNAQYAMIVKARKPMSADPAARPSRPSVTFTALVVLQTMRPAQITHTTQCRVHPGEDARVNDRVSLIPVPAESHQHVSSANASVIQLLRFQKMPRLCDLLTLM